MEFRMIGQNKIQEVLTMAKKPNDKQQTSEYKARLPGDKKLDGPNRPST